MAEVELLQGLRHLLHEHLGQRHDIVEGGVDDAYGGHGEQLTW